jgi:hypothetical protein
MDHPVFVPNRRLHLSKEFSLFQPSTKLGAEDWRKRFDGDKKVSAGRAPATVVSDTTAGDEVMDVGMVEELAGPGVEHADHTWTTSNEPWVLSQLLESCGGSAQEQIVDQLLMVAS